MMNSNSNRRIGIVLLAAGNASRFGSAKQFLPIDGVPLVRHCAAAAVDTGATVVVVTGAYRQQVEEHLSGLPAIAVFNPDWQLGMGGSIACGVEQLRNMKPPIEAAIIALADQPLITSVELSQFIAAHARARDRIVAATCNGVRGPPCLFPRAYFDDLAQLRGTRGARSLLERHAAQVDALAISCSIDIDVQEDFTRLRAL